MIFKIDSLEISWYPQKTPVMEPLYKDIADLKALNFTKKKPQHWSFWWASYAKNRACLQFADPYHCEMKRIILVKNVIQQLSLLSCW